MVKNSNKSIHKQFISSLNGRAALWEYTDAIRFINGAADGFPGLTIDCFSNLVLIQEYLPVEQSTLQHLVDEVTQTLRPEGIRLQSRKKQDTGKKNDYLVSPSGWKTVVREGDCRFLIDLDDGIQPGLFLDMRKNREVIAELSSNKKVLNLFSYTCAFGTQCRKKGAVETVNVDISKKHLEKGKQNYILSHLSFFEKEFFKLDARRYLDYALKNHIKFDVIVIDPPTFSRSGKAKFQVKQEMPKMAQAACELLSSNGALFLSTNDSQYTPIQLKSDALGAAKAAGRQVTHSQIMPSDLDFPTTEHMPESSLSAVLMQLD